MSWSDVYRNNVTVGNSVQFQQILMGFSAAHSALISEEEIIRYISFNSIDSSWHVIIPVTHQSYARNKEIASNPNSLTF